MMPQMVLGRPAGRASECGFRGAGGGRRVWARRVGLAHVSLHLVRRACKGGRRAWRPLGQWGRESG